MEEKIIGLMLASREPSEPPLTEAATVALLSERGKQTARSISATTGYTPNRVRAILSALMKRGLVQRELRNKREHLYFLSKPINWRTYAPQTFKALK